MSFDNPITSKTQLDEKPVEGNDESPFMSRSMYRTHELRVEGRSLYVNPSVLAELSPYFEAIFYGTFKEAAAEYAELKERSFDEVLLFLEFTSAGVKNREMAVGKVPALYRLADLWNVEDLKKRCIEYLENDFLYSATVDLNECVDLLEIFTKYEITGVAVENVLCCISGWSLISLVNAKVSERISNPNFIAAIYHTCAKEFGQNGRVHSTKTVESMKCSVHKCDTLTTTLCISCRFAFCTFHIVSVCTRVSNAEKPLESSELVIKRFGWQRVDPVFGFGSDC